MKTNEITKPRYGITERKKNELDTLTIQVLDAKTDVEKCQAVVTALTDKLTQFQNLLAIADAKRAGALNQVNLIKQLLQSTLTLRDDSDIAFNEIVLANAKTKTLAENVKKVMDMLIFSAEVINKLSNMIIRQKALNPLISDELVNSVAQAGTDANKAIALLLVALQSTSVTQASNLESEGGSSLEYEQSLLLYQMLSGTDLNGNPDPQDTISLTYLLSASYNTAKSYSDQIQEDLNRTTYQLNSARITLNKAQVKLKSLQAGLAAANAAALA